VTSGAATLFVAALLDAAAAAAPGDVPRLLRRVRFDDPPTLLALQEPVFPGSIPQGSPVRLGGIFSTLLHDPKDSGDVFWAASDRGPNDEVTVDGDARRTFLAPGYDPAIFRLRVDGERIRIDRTLFLETREGGRVTGLPNRPGIDEVPYDGSGQTALAYNADGVDTEALERTPDGRFWLGEEYGPSLLHVGPDGRVLMRYAPIGSRILAPGYPVAETLPAVFNRRKPNRGFEALAASRDGTRLFAVIQSPLLNPDKATGEASRILRLLVIDAATGRPIAEHAVVAEAAGALGQSRQSEAKVNEARRVNDHVLLLLEGTDFGAARVFVVDLARATNLLGTPWDDPLTSPSLEALGPGDLAGKGIVPATKSLAVNLDALIPDLPLKIEGLAILDARTIVVGNDNEFAIRGAGGATAPRSEVLFVRLPKPLPMN
jgi:hypothetical protein